MAGKTRHLKQKFLLSVRAEPAKNWSRYACGVLPFFLLDGMWWALAQASGRIPLHPFPDARFAATHPR